MNADKLTKIVQIIGTVLFIVAIIAGNIWGGTVWAFVVCVAAILVLTRTAYEMIHFKEYKKSNINFLVCFPIIVIVILILRYFNVL